MNNPYAPPPSMVDHQPEWTPLMYLGRRIYLIFALGSVGILLSIHLSYMKRNLEMTEMYPNPAFGPWHMIVWQLLIIAPFVALSPLIGTILGQLFQKSKLYFWSRFIITNIVIAIGLSFWSILMEAGRFLVYENEPIANTHLGNMAMIMPVILSVAFAIVNGLVCLILLFYSRKYLKIDFAASEQT